MTARESCNRSLCIVGHNNEQTFKPRLFAGNQMSQSAKATAESGTSGRAAGLGTPLRPISMLRFQRPSHTDCGFATTTPATRIQTAWRTRPSFSARAGDGRQGSFRGTMK